MCWYCLTNAVGEVGEASRSSASARSPARQAHGASEGVARGMAYKAARNPGFRSAIRYSVGASLASALAIAIAIATPATAQETQEGSDSTGGANGDARAENTIIVSGIRGSLQRNLDAKREAPGVVDVISSEEIGKFPDSNVAASLQRVPGVSIQRDGMRGEANGVTIRGFGGDFNETLVDGRRLSTATGGRSIDFSTVGSDFIGSLSVYKTPNVAISSNSIGATINISYPRPLDRPGFHVAATASASYQEALSLIHI